MAKTSLDARPAAKPIFHGRKTAKPKLRDGCQFLAWLTCEEPEKDAAFYDHCHGHWDAAKNHAQMHWEAGHVQGCYEVMCEDWKGDRRVVIVNVHMIPRFEATSKQIPLEDE